MQKTAEQIEHDLLRPLFHSSGKYWVAVALATSLLLAGVAAFGYQLYSGPSTSPISFSGSASATQAR
jgi:hypothetical protein